MFPQICIQFLYLKNGLESFFLEKKYLRGMSAERIFSLLRTARYHVMDDTGDIVAVEMSEDAVKAFRKMHLDQLLYTMVSNQTLKGVIRSTKVNDC